MSLRFVSSHDSSSGPPFPFLSSLITLMAPSRSRSIFRPQVCLVLFLLRKNVTYNMKSHLWIITIHISQQSMSQVAGGVAVSYSTALR